MSKAVLISINPKWCELIASGEKTIEVRKTRPKLERPFKCYIYRTKGTVRHLIGGKWVNMPVGGTVIGEFVCDSISNYEAELWDDETFERIQEFYEPDDFSEYGEYEYKTIADCSDDFWKDNMLCKASCLTIEELRKYLGGGFTEFYGWHISDLKIYDRPKELSEFYTVVENEDCDKCRYYGTPYESEPCNQCQGGRKYLKRPPQNWCYVEEMEAVE